MRTASVALCLVLVALAIPANAQVTQYINYQGRLIDGTNLVNDTVSLVLRVYDSAMAGTLLCEDSNDVAVVDGLYATFIGDNITEGSLEAIAASADAFVEVEVNGTRLEPRERVGWVAYALNADRVGNMAASSFATGAPLYAYTETDPTFAASAAFAISALNTSEWSDAYAWGDHAAAGYATGTPLYAFTETDPVWTTASNDIQSQIFNNESLISNLETSKVSKTGDTMTGDLIVTDAVLRISKDVNRGSGVYDMLIIGGGSSVEIGHEANGYHGGIAIGPSATGYFQGVAVGQAASGKGLGTAIGPGANGDSIGSAVGHGANAYLSGSALGQDANGSWTGVAVGSRANGERHGVAVGISAVATNYGVAVGDEANGGQTNIALGRQANAGGGSQRIAIGNNVVNTNNDSAAIRGTLYLDGGTAVYHRTTFGSGAWVSLLDGVATGTPLYAFTETDPVWAAEKSGYATGAPVYVETDPVWAAEKSGYATGTPLYAFTETDPVWSGASNDIQSQISNLDTAKVSKTGDTMTGALNMSGQTITNVGRIDFSVEGIAIGRAANAPSGAVAVGHEANGRTSGAAVGYRANSRDYGAAIGYIANAVSYGAAVGHNANGMDYGVAVGYDANARTHGAVLGVQANGMTFGSAVGQSANGYDYGTALGVQAHGINSGVAVGYQSLGSQNGVAVGHGAYAAHTNIAIGMAAHSGLTGRRIAIGAQLTNDINDSAAIRGTLYLDGGTGVYYRSTFGGGTWVNLLDGVATGTPLYAYTESDPVWSSEKSGYATGTPLYAFTETDPVWAAEKSGYATGTPVYAETDPVWTAASNDIQSQISNNQSLISNLNTAKVSKTGDTMTGALTINSGPGNDLVINSAGTVVAIGGSANGLSSGVAVGYGANGYNNGAALGTAANGGQEGIALGSGASGYNSGAAAGRLATANDFGAAVGRAANGVSVGAAVGYQANGNNSGAGIGYLANGHNFGAAVGRAANGAHLGAAVGYWADGTWFGAAIGYLANGSGTNVAVGHAASAGGGSERIAIGHNVTNAVNDSAAIRGTLYLDGDTGVFYRSSFGSGAWVNLLDGVATGTPLYAFTETDPTFAASAAFAISALNTSEWSDAYAWGDHAAAGYATGTPLYVYTETDPNAVLADGSRAMTGDLDMGGFSITNVADGSIVFEDGTAIAAADVQNWNTGKLEKTEWQAADSTTNYVRRTGDTMTGALTINAGVDQRIVIGSSGTDVSIGNTANGDGGGVAIGQEADGSDFGAAVGAYADGSGYGAVLGYSVYGSDHGAAVGNDANAFTYGAAIGDVAYGYQYGAAVGASTRAHYYGVALGYQANGQRGGVAVGAGARGTYSNIAIGVQANADGGTNRIAIGVAVAPEFDNSVTVRGDLYLDGGRTVYYRQNFGMGAFSDILTGYVQEFELTALSNNLVTSDFATNYVRRTGDTMTGALTINASSGLVIGSASNNVAIGRAANAGDRGVAIGNSATGLTTAVAIGSLAAASGGGAAVGISANARDYGAALGSSANAYNYGVAIGQSASGSRGVAVGLNSSGGNFGAAMGEQSDGSTYGAVVGRTANGSSQGAVVGASANGSSYGAALGYSANAYNNGIAAGWGASAWNAGLAIGYLANGIHTNIAIGYQANAGGATATNRIAIGRDVVNTNNNSAVIRGTLYLDGATGIQYRPTFGSGAWTDMTGAFLPLDGSRAMTGDLDMGNHSITNVKTNTIVFTDGSHAVRSSGDTISGTMTFQSGVVIGGVGRTTWPGDAAAWSSFPATQTVNMAGQSLTNLGSASISTGVFSSGIQIGLITNAPAAPQPNYGTLYCRVDEPQDPYTALLVHFNGANGATQVLDMSGAGRTGVFTSAAMISTNHAIFGGSSLRTVTVPASYVYFADDAGLRIGTNDYTIEFFARLDLLYESHGYIDKGWSIGGYWGGPYYLYFNDGYSLMVTTNLNIQGLSWTHFAVAREGYAVRMFLDGKVVLAQTNGYIVDMNSTANLRIGSTPYLGNYYFNGYIDEVRVSKGIARYKSDFTPPAAQFYNGGGYGLYFMDANGREKRVMMSDP